MDRSEREILEDLLNTQKKTLLYTRIASAAVVVFAAAVLVSILMVMPRVFRTMDNADRTLADIETLSGDAKKSLKEIDSLVDGAQGSIANIEKLATDADKIIEDNAEALAGAMENISGVDFDALNTSIKNLEAVSERLNKVTSIFGG